MDRFAAMIVLLVGVVTTVLMVLTLFVMTPVVCSCMFSLLYSVYLFVAYEESGVHHAQEFENRFWTLFAMLLSTALVFASDSPIAFGLTSPALGFLTVLVSGYTMHLWDRYQHRQTMSQTNGVLRRNTTGSQSLVRLKDLGIPVDHQLSRINTCLNEIDQLLIPSTINNFLNQRFVLSKEREIITIFQECDARALNYLISHVKLGLLFYKIKDHRHFNGKHRTELINLLAVERLPILTVVSRVILLHSLQLLKLRANPQAENWVRNILLNTYQDDLSNLKSMNDSKGDYFCMPKLVYDDIRSETVRQDILRHIRREAAIMRTHIQMGTKRWRSVAPMQWRKVLSDVDDTLCCSGGMYPAGVDKRFPRKTVYPGVLAFYRELDLGIEGPDEWHDDRTGNLVFLSARPHVYKDMSEKANFAKFEKLRAHRDDGRKGLHTMPSLLAGDLASGGSYIVTNDFEPLAQKKFDNFKRYVSIYPEFQHVFVCDNGQGDVRAGELMFDGFPYEFEGLYVHIVTDVSKTHGYAPERWRQKEFRPFFFRTYPEAALHAATRYPPLIRMEGLQRICAESVKDFVQIKSTSWPTETAKVERALELNQAVWQANQFLTSIGRATVELVRSERRWMDGEKVRTPYGIGTICGYDPVFDLYDVQLDWRPLDVQLEEHNNAVSSKEAFVKPKTKGAMLNRKAPNALETVHEDEEAGETQQGGESSAENQNKPSLQSSGETDESKPAAVVAAAAAAASPKSESAEEEMSSEDSANTADAVPADDAAQPKQNTGGVRARIGGRCITKYTPPVLPRIDKRTSLFSFRPSPTAESKEIVPVPVGEQCSTPYGVAKVVEYKKSQNQNFVVVEMVGWNAKAYLRQSEVKPLQKGLLTTFLERLTSAEIEQKPDFPFPEGTKLPTAFGPGTISRPIMSPNKKQHRQDPLRQSAHNTNPYQTVAISLESWKLADGSSPVLYCTPETAKEWKEKKGQTSIFSTLGTLVTTTLIEPFMPSQHSKETPPPPIFKQYYQDGAAVSTEFGHGMVKAFRPETDMYEVSLVGWKLAGGKHPVAYLRKDDLRTRIADGCQEGYPVLTNLGVSGTLASVEPKTGVHIVTVPTSNMVCYMQPDCIVVPLKAAVGEDVSTAFGEGKVVFYDRRNDTYTIRLNGWNAVLYAKSDTFERLGEGVQDRDGFGVKWLLRFLFFSNDASSSVTRSRSNSITSHQSNRSQSNRSVS